MSKGLDHNYILGRKKKNPMPAYLLKPKPKPKGQRTIPFTAEMLREDSAYRGAMRLKGYPR